MTVAPCGATLRCSAQIRRSEAFRRSSTAPSNSRHMPPRRQRAALTVLVVFPGLVALGGCPSRDEGTSNVTRRDSAGIAIVESSRAMWDGSEVWTVDTAATVSIGAVAGEAPYLLNRVAGATRLPDGRVVVADGGSSQLRFFDSTGAF